MPLLSAVVSAGAVFLGAIAAFLGAILVISALTTGTLHLTYGDDGKLITEVIARAADPARFWKLVTVLGVLPAIAGAFAARWGWRRIRTKP